MMSASDVLGRNGVVRLWKVLEGTAACISVAFGIASFVLWMYYDSTRPTIADSSIGRIYPLNTHGSIVYLSQAETFRLHALMWIAGIFGVIAVCIDIFAKPFRS